MSKGFRTVRKKKTVKNTFVGAKILDVKRNKESGRFVLILDNGNIVHVGSPNKGEVSVARKKY